MSTRDGPAVEEKCSVIAPSVASGLRLHGRGARGEDKRISRYQLSDPDLPGTARRLAGLQLRAGRLAVLAVNLLKPRLSLGVRLVALDEAGWVFLVRHSYLPGLHLPGGGVDAGESCRDAVLREAREEGGLELPGPPELFHVYWNRALAGRDHVVLFVARGARQGAPRTARLEIVGGGFYPVDALPPDASPATRARLAEVLEGTPAGDVW